MEILYTLESESHSVVSDSLQLHGPHIPWNSPGQNTGLGSLSLLQGIFPTQGWSPGLPHCRRILYQLSHQGSPRILEWVACPSPEDLPDPGIEPGSPALQADSVPAEPPGKSKSKDPEPSAADTEGDCQVFSRYPSIPNLLRDFILNE